LLTDDRLGLIMSCLQTLSAALLFSNRRHEYYEYEGQVKFTRQVISSVTKDCTQTT
jgi:hypothetical protein